MRKTFYKADLARKEKDYEHNLLERFSVVLPSSVKVTIIADRGFSNVCLLEKMANLGFSHVVRLRKNLIVKMQDGTKCDTQEVGISWSILPILGNRHDGPGQTSRQSYCSQIIRHARAIDTRPKRRYIYSDISGRHVCSTIFD